MAAKYKLNELTISLSVCPRCLQAHHMPLVFRALENPIVENDGTEWQYWASCTNTLAPILARSQPRPDGGEDFVTGT